MGTTPYGGHGLAAAAAQDVAVAVAAGATPPQAAVMPDIKQALEALHGIDDATASGFLRLVLTTLAVDKQLPKYQFERRIDAFLTPFLPRIVEHTLGGGTAQLVAPEFPISNQSTNADHLVLVRDRPGSQDTWLLVELKTDTGSYNPVQAQIYAEAVEDGWTRLRADLDIIRNASTKKAGYTHLIKRVDAAAGGSGATAVEVMYLTPISNPPKGFHSVHYSELMRLEVDVYPEVWTVLQALILPALL